MKRRLACICIFALTLGWMTMIFAFSAQNADESGGLSAVIAEPLTRMIMKIRGLPREKFDSLYLQVDGGVRVLAHFAEYAILGILTSILCWIVRWKSFWIPWVICTVFAATDEWHQYYSPGRASEMKDVIIDSSGAICGIILFCLIRKFRISRQGRCS